MANNEIAWTFKTARFEVVLTLNYDLEYQYDGDDEDGSTQAALDAGKMVAFNSIVEVFLDRRCIGWDSLGGSVYYAHDVAAFWQAHRVHKQGTYFSDMVREAIAEARKVLCGAPKVRCAA